MQSVLFAHQSAELYGSDRVLLNVVCALDRTRFHPIVLLPADGPLATALQEAGIETHVVELVKIARSSFGPGNLLRNARAVRQSLRSINTVLAGRRPAVVYTNTVAVLGAAVWAWLHRAPHVWHVHEIVERPRVVSWGLTRLVSGLADAVLCNSSQTLAWVGDGRAASLARSTVVWNGIGPRPAMQPDQVAALRHRMGASADDIVVTLTGRINHWKGQTLFIDAASALVARGQRGLRFAIVGGVVPGPTGEQMLRDMLAHMAASPAAGSITWIDFTPDVWPVWDATDIAVVPSTLPEPFGMVAIEAMAAGKPVVAAAHGGLVDIVADQVTGRLVPPNQAGALADAIQQLVESADLRNSMGAAGARRQQELFSLDAQVAAITGTLARLAGPGA